jgi:hypothetical protein
MAGVGFGVPGAEPDEGGPAAGGEQQRVAFAQGPDGGCVEDALAAQADRLAEAVAGAGQAGQGDVVLSGEAGDVLGEARVVDAGADELDGGG